MAYRTSAYRRILRRSSSHPVEVVTFRAYEFLGLPAEAVLEDG